jgi:hypothetical protein
MVLAGPGHEIRFRAAETAIPLEMVNGRLRVEEPVESMTIDLVE